MKLLARSGWVLVLAAWAAPLRAQGDAWAEAIRPVAPGRIADDLYYVGTADLAVYLFTSPAGHVLLDAGPVESVAHVLEAIRRVGFKPGDVRLLINSHGHFDHAGGLAELKRRTGARLAVSEPEAALIARGGRGDFGLGDGAAYPAAAADRVLRDGDTVRAGPRLLTAHLTPGHTRGCTTWTTAVRDGARSYRVAFICSLSVLSMYRLTGRESYPGILADYRRSIGVVRGLPCEIMLAPHTSFIRDFHGKLARIRSSGSVEALVDPTACRRYADRAEQNLEAHLAEERRGTARPH
ncbi:MAG TPA: subclass B3 metallo-beta-lactamase [Gemmatimonadales bacterium]|nr:subclass B3 metallo-beta-lactamase [Gemmatimonadales bacterium]